MNPDQKKFERDFLALCCRYDSLTGAEIQSSVLSVINGYYDDHEEVFTFNQLINKLGQSIALNLAKEQAKGETE